MSIKNKGGRPTKARQCTKQNIDMAIKSTQSMSQAAIYMGVSLNTFKKYAKQYDLWAPLPSSKGVRRSVNSTFTRDIGLILQGKSPNPYREATLLSKAIREGYMKPCCSNCNADFTESQRKDPPLILDFLDKNPQNTELSNLRALCFNCVYELYYTLKGWYRHRDTAIRQAYNEIPDNLEPAQEPETDKKSDIDYIAFEEFQKML
tara:strand:- start:88 stop:702 length:615 start_codon:yes stop_codon:yes gene_type:complete